MNAFFRGEKEERERENKASLQEMYLDQNKFIGILEDEEFPNSFSSPLLTLDLSHNLLEGNIPNFISKLTSLKDLSSNIMLSINASDIAINIPNLYFFNFPSCNLSEFPRFLRYQPNSYDLLDLSNNQLQEGNACVDMEQG
ncbi:hypothetical protein Scep_002702 [Stephania cephalantha]|uniref:Uncharacterized protein n=1 Tax=Stephania cephalantha TaxID=152367 RepID=A0AAP0LAP7_9MAGN